MLYVVHAIDKKDGLDLRLATRDRHLAYLDDLGDRLVMAGPYVDGDGKATGSMLVYRTDSLVEAEELAARDPYAEAGLFTEVTVRPWKWLIRNRENIA